jgi:7,8-dihydropterin-6-yl-methyl-4-(beta-D-ribofuranosyl)aminobenzene 5'-phosphate synthase
MKVTCLIENLKNPSHPDLANEHGLSLFIEYEEHKILFDTGASGKFDSNAKILGIDLSDVDKSVLSHGHYDHSGGLETFFSVNNKAPLYISPHAVEPHFFKALLFMKREVSIDNSVINSNSSRLEFIDRDTEISKGVHILPIHLQKYPQPPGNRYLYTLKDGVMFNDDFNHELLMVIVEDDGMTVFSGCSHNGILNMVEVALKKFPETPIKAIIGGFHMIGLPFFNHMPEKKENVQFIGQKLLEYSLKKAYSGHCTGNKAYKILKDVMGDKLSFIRPGTVIEL